MTLFNRPLAAITAEDLAALVGEVEGKFIDFKRDRVGGTEGDRKEFLADVSSFANTQGGDLVFGIEEAKGGVAKAVDGLDGVDGEAEVTRLMQMARSGIRPPIAGLDARAIVSANGRPVIVLRVPRSWSAPHQVTFGGVFRFYARDTNNKYAIDVDELRSAFVQASGLADRLRSFRVDRLARIASGDAPAPLQPGPRLVLHVAPFSSFSAGASFPLADALHDPKAFPPWKANAANLGITFEGLVATSNHVAPPAPQRAYSLVSQTGVVEAVTGLHDYDSVPELQAIIAEQVRHFTKSLETYGIDPPYAVFVSLDNAAGMRVIHDFRPQQFAVLEDLPGAQLTASQYPFVDSVVEAAPANRAGAAQAIRATLDHLANAAGLPTSPHFDQAGNYQLGG